MQIKKNKFKIIVKTKAKNNEITEFDKEEQSYRLNIKAIPQKGNANKEIIKFLSKLLKKQVRIIKGLKSKKKTIETI